MANFNTGLTKLQIITALTKALESMSEQEVQSAISTAISGKQDILSFDNTPTSDSSNPVTSGGIYTDQQRQDAVIADKWGYTKPTIGGTGDFNTVVSSGYYRYNGSPANAPTGASGEFGVLLVYAAGSYISQTAHCFLTSRYGLYIRSSTNTGSTWTVWTQLGGTSVAAVQSAPASLMQAGRIDAEMTDDIDNDASEKSGGEEMR